MNERDEWKAYRVPRVVRVLETIRYTYKPKKGQIFLKKGQVGRATSYNGNKLYCTFQFQSRGTFNCVLTRSQVEIIK